jgi:hypothetical protein
MIRAMKSPTRSPRMFPLSTADEMTVARRRMKHLAPWRIEPVPAVHVAARSRPWAPLTGESKERYRRVALNVLAMQMAEAASWSPPASVMG